jgi:hypothetical protein
MNPMTTFHFRRAAMAVGAVALGAWALPYMLGALVYLFSPTFHCKSSPVSRVKADLRSLSTAIESYLIDRGAYPVGRPLRDFARDRGALAKAGGADLLAPEPGQNRWSAGLTTPIPYLQSLFTDPFTAERLPFAYWPVGSRGWIVFSPGPDGDYDIDPLTDYDPDERVPSVSLIRKTYDPSNGAQSGGDIWRTKNE